MSTVHSLGHARFIRGLVWAASSFLLSGCAAATSAEDPGVVKEEPAGISAQAIIDGCSGSGGAHTDNWGATYGTSYCNAYRGGNVVGEGKTRGHLNAGKSWFVCQERFEGKKNPVVGSAANDWWLYTQADTRTDGYQGWGWFPATYVSGGSNWSRVPGLRDCGEIPIFTGSEP